MAVVCAEADPATISTLMGCVPGNGGTTRNADEQFNLHNNEDKYSIKKEEQPEADALGLPTLICLNRKCAATTSCFLRSRRQ